MGWPADAGLAQPYPSGTHESVRQRTSGGRRSLQNQALRDHGGDIRRHRPRGSLPVPRESPWDNDELLREELFSIERLEQHATSLAAAQQVTARPPRRPRLACGSSDNESVLLGAYRAIAQGRRAKVAPSPRPPNGCSTTTISSRRRSGRSARTCRPGFYRQLPKLAQRALRGIPARVRHRLGVRRPHRQPFRPGLAAAVRARVPDRAAADHRRAVGRRDHAAHRARGEPAPRGAAHRRAAAPHARTADDIADRLLGVNGHAAEPDALLERYGDGTRLPRGLRRPAGAAPARPGSEGDAGTHVAGGAACRRRARRPRRSCATSTSGRAART